MTRDEALARIDQIVQDPSFQPGTGSEDDMRELIGLLPDALLERLSPGWISQQHGEPSVIQFLWSRSGIRFAPGNRITLLRTLGSGAISVVIEGMTLAQDTARWQIGPDGEPSIGIIYPSQPGAQDLVNDLAHLQFPQIP